MVPAAVPGIVFRSGGQSAEQVKSRLDALNRTGPQPWQLSFSFGRPLQEPVLCSWASRSSDWLACSGLRGRNSRRQEALCCFRPPPGAVARGGPPTSGATSASPRACGYCGSDISTKSPCQPWYQTVPSLALTESMPSIRPSRSVWSV